MGDYHIGGYKVYRPIGFFFTQKIGEYAYQFATDEEEEINGDSITIYGSTILADASDFLRAFPQYQLDDYLFRLSIAQIQFMAVDNTHTKYLHGHDKKVWANYKDALESQRKLDNFMAGLGKFDDLEEGEEIEISVRPQNNKKIIDKKENK